MHNKAAMSKFRAALLAKLDETGLSLKAVADGAGVSYEALKKVKQRDTASTDVEVAMRVAAFFGLSLDEFMGGSPSKDQVEIIRAWHELTPEQRLRLQGYIEALRSLHDPSP